MSLSMSLVNITHTDIVVIITNIQLNVKNLWKNLMIILTLEFDSIYIF